MPEDPIKSQLKQHLEDILPSVWLEGHGDIEVELDNKPELKGATDALFYEAEAKITFVIKFGLNDIPKEKKGYRILKQAPTNLKKHLVPLIGEDKDIEDLGLNKAILLTPLINSLTLHDLVAQKACSKQWLFELYFDFLNELSILWKQTCKPIKPNLESIYLVRLKSRYSEFKRKFKLKETSKIKFIINGKEMQMEKVILPTIQKKILGFKGSVKNSCTIHGDEHAKNILIKKSNIGREKKAWVLIDCGNASKQGDWIFSIAKILHWWNVYFAIENAKTKKDLKGYCAIKKQKVEIKYDKVNFDKKIPKICKELNNRTLDFCNKVNREIFHEKESVWRERLKIALFIMLFGAVTRHYEPEKKFAIPFLIGESFRFLKIL